MRDLRLDLIRGLSLLIIFIDHLAELCKSFSGVKYYFPTIRTLGLCSAAEIFIFISGYVSGLVYYTIYIRSGFAHGLTHACRRAVQLYMANTLIFTLSLFIVFRSNTTSASYLRFTDFDFFLHQPLAAIADFVSFQYMPGYTDILAIYVFFLAALPFALFIMRRSLAVFVMLLVATYLLSQTFGAFNLSAMLHKAGDPIFNPLSWQILFFGGVVLGSRQWLEDWRGPKAAWFPAALFAVLALVAILKSARMLAGAAGGAHPELAETIAAYADLALSTGRDAITLGPVRVVYFCVLFAFLLRVLPTSARLAGNALARPFIACGQNSLVVFWTGVLLSHGLAITHFRLHGHHSLFLALVAGGLAILMLTAGIATAGARRAPRRDQRETDRLPNAVATGDADGRGSVRGVQRAPAGRLGAAAE
jgi:hypothetical protein